MTETISSLEVPPAGSIQTHWMWALPAACQGERVWVPKQLTHYVTKVHTEVLNHNLPRDLNTNVNERRLIHVGKSELKEDWVSQGKSTSLAPQGHWFKSNSIWQDESCCHITAASLSVQNKLVVSSQTLWNCCVTSEKQPRFQDWNRGTKIWSILNQIIVTPTEGSLSMLG